MVEDSRSKANALMNPSPGLRHRWGQAGRHWNQTRVPATQRQANRAQASHMPGACWNMPSICQPHVTHIWPIASMGHWCSPHSICRWDHLATCHHLIIKLAKSTSLV